MNFRIYPNGFGLVLGVIVALGVVITPQSAEASLKLCNQTSYMLEGAIAYRANGRWKVEGWWTLQPGLCNTVIQEPLRGDDYYTFARAIEGHRGDVEAWGGGYAFCTGEGTFSLTNKSDCAAEGLSLFGFAKVDHGNVQAWTNTFTEPVEYSASKARIAGIQRLLIDIGYKQVRIDGYMGRRTRLAIAKHKREHKLPEGDFLTNALFDSLSREANRQASDAGLQLCNQTPHPLHAAVGYEKSKDNWVSLGWFHLVQNECRKVLKDKLDRQHYYTYAEADIGEGEILVWGGKREFCVNDIRFAIEGDKNCTTRGLDSRSFRQINTEKRGKWRDFFTIENMSVEENEPVRMVDEKNAS